MTAGYSKRSLVEKLGIKAQARIAIIGAPPGYSETLGSLPGGVVTSTRLTGNMDFIHAFFSQAAALRRQFPVLKKALGQSGSLWISWPKKAARMATDVDENVVREIGLQHGLVDIKVCAVDEVWSGLKFVYRKDQRTS